MRVGSGSGIGDLLRGNFNIFGNNGSSTSSSAVKSALAKTQAHPNDLTALQSVASHYEIRYQDKVTEGQSLQAQAPLTLAGVVGVSSASPLGQLLTQDTASQQLVQKANVAFTDANTALQKDAQLYKRIAKLQPTDVNTQFHYAQLADLTGDTAAAVAAYRKVIQLAPTDPSAQQARQRIAVLAPAKHG